MEKLIINDNVVKTITGVVSSVIDMAEKLDQKGKDYFADDAARRIIVAIKSANDDNKIVFKKEEITVDENDIQKMISEECDDIKNLLIEKNKAYGNSALEPLRIFSNVDNIEQIKVRIDDKLSRIKHGTKTSIQEDTEQDLIGYLVLLRICKKIEAKNEKEK